VDLFRYFVLYDFGGLYVDLDIMARGPIDVPLGQSFGDIFLVHSANTPSHYTNALMASTLRPSAKRFWSSMVAHVESWPTKLSEKVLGHALRHLQIMMSTGPMALTKVANESLEAITVLPQRRWNPFDLSVAGDLEEQVSDEALVNILSGSSWHDVDSQAISLLHVYKWPLIAIAILLGLYTIIHARLMYQRALALVRSIRMRKKEIKK
jgi:mannosyltransferase OCH1-like enzyme